jgi:hypothetical protein
MTTTALTPIERAAVALGSSKAAAELAELAAASKSITAVTNKDGRTECHAACMKAREARLSVEKIGEAAREDAKNFSAAVIAEQKRLVAIIEPEEKRLKALRDEFDAKVEAEKEAKRLAEAARIAAIQKRIDDIKNLVVSAAMIDAAGAAVLIAEMTATEIDDSFGDLYGVAVEARAESLAKLRDLHAAKVAQEAEVRRLQAEREEQARQAEAERQRLAAERAEHDKRMAEERAALDKQRAEDAAKLEAERAELARQQAQQAQIDRVAREQAETRAAEARAKQEAEEKLAREARAAEELRLDVERAELLIQRAAIEEREKAERERREAEETARQRRAEIAALTPPEEWQVVDLIADHFAMGDCNTAARWLAGMTFSYTPAAEELKAA